MQPVNQSHRNALCLNDFFYANCSKRTNECVLKNEVCVLFAIQYDSLGDALAQATPDSLPLERLICALAKKTRRNKNRNSGATGTYCILHTNTAPHMPYTHSYGQNSIAFCVVYQEMWLIMQCMNVRYGFNFVLTPFAGMLMCLCWIRSASTSELEHLPGSHIRFMALQRFLLFFFPPIHSPFVCKGFYSVYVFFFITSIGGGGISTTGAT